MRYRTGVLSCLVLLLVAHCQVYDEAPLKAGKDTLKSSAQTIPVSKSNNVPDEQPDDPARAQVSPPEPPPTRCGDGIISGVEKCDTAIESSESGACPSECPPLAPCAPRVLNGTACQAECVLIEPSCKDGDGCCPGSCDPATDSDCSRACGDGMIDAERGETCEPSKHACEKSDADCADNDPCTKDRLLGSPRNCNSLCSHTVITERVADDHCCPDGADNSVDNDCAPVCGNGVRERGEDCDGDVGCGQDCKSPTRQAQNACIERFGTDECKRCACTHCTELVVACWDSGQATSDAQCSAVVDCGLREHCVDVDCFCAPGNLPCIPTGPCNMQISAAAGTNDPFLVSTIAMDPNTTLGRAKNVTACRVEKCQKECGAPVAQ